MCYSFSKSMSLKNVKFAHTHDNSKRRRNEIHLLILITIELFANLSNCSGTKTLNDQQTTFVRALAIVPTTHKESDLNLLPTWMKGEEILPAIQLAVKEINEQYNFLRGHQLEVISVRVPMCDLNEGNLQFVKTLETNTEILGFVGYVCQNLDQHFVHLLKHKEISAIQITANTPPVTTDKYSRSGSHLQFSILPSSQSTARAAVQLMQKLEWKRIAVISSKTYFIQRTEFLQEAKAHGIEVALDLQTFTRTSSNTILKQLQTAGINIIVSFLPPSEFVNILCCAYLEGIKWPHYAWIFLQDIDSLNEFQHLHKICPQNISITAAMNNTILIRQKSPSSNANNILPSGLKYSNYYSRYLQELEELKTELSATLQTNPYSNVFYDSIWAFAISLNRSLNMLKENNLSLANISHAKSEILEIFGEQLSELSFHGASGFLNFSSNTAALQTTVELFQFHNSNQFMIGSYDLTSDLLQLNATTLKIISVTTLHYTYIMYSLELPIIIITVVLTVLFIALTTVSMCLYFYYRKQPSIKATSTTLTICLFVGCYILLLSSLIYSITNALFLSEEQVMKIRVSLVYQAFLCTSDFYLSSFAVDLIFATIIAKTLRIYHIFNKFGKVNRICSDQCLFILILIIVSVKVVLIVLWTCLDVNYLVFEEQFISQSVPPFIFVTSKCQSNYIEIWTGILLGYSLLLTLIMIVLAALTRKIKRQHFNDSKVICKLVFLLVMTLSITVSLWFIFYYVDATAARLLVYNVGIIIAVFIYQAVPIFPKICPLVRRTCQQSFLHPNACQ